MTAAGIWVTHTATVRDGEEGSASPISQNKLALERFRNLSKITQWVGTERFEPPWLRTPGEDLCPKNTVPVTWVPRLPQFLPFPRLEKFTQVFLFICELPTCFW